MIDVKIGQTLIAKKDHTIITEFGNERKVLAGNKIIVGADGMAHHVTSDMIQGLNEDFKVEGYDTKGLAEYLYARLDAQLPIKEAMEDYSISALDVIHVLKDALDELGFDSES